MDFLKTGEKDDMLRLSDGKNSAWFAILELTALDGREYAALLQQDDDEPLILEVCEPLADGREVFRTVDDDDVFDRVCDALEDALNED